MEDDLNRKMETTFKTNGRRPQQKICSQFLSNLGTNVSWGWLSSLRFYEY
jgi:hypothetical protein